VTDLGVSLWSVFFLVPVGRGRPEDEVSADEYEAVFEKLAVWAAQGPFDLKSTAAPHYRRYLMQQRVKAARLRREVVRGGPSSPERAVAEAAAGGGIERAPRAVNDGNGLVFVSHTGEIYPSGFLPLAAGNIRKDSLVEVYRTHPLFVGLRDFRWSPSRSAPMFPAPIGSSWRPVRRSIRPPTSPPGRAGDPRRKSRDTPLGDPRIRR
ncbi:MAG: radical SAM family Fe-S protein, partial [bacterium]